MTETWDHSVDVLVVGSGIGAMVAALTASDAGASVLLIERSERYGGSSAMSAGGLWIPNNRLMGELGIDDSKEEAWTYLKAATEGTVPDDRLRAFLDGAPEMIDYLLAKTHLEMVPLAYPDYYPLLPGSRPGGRSIEPIHFHASALGDEFSALRDQSFQSMIAGRIFMTLAEIRPVLSRSPGWIGIALRLALGYCLDLPWRFQSKRDRNLALGNALVGMLRRSLMDRDVPLWLRTPAREILVEDGCVVGARAEKEGRTMRIRATQGVLLGAGGFEANQAMREKYLPHPTRAEWTCASPDNQGDAIEMGRVLGAGLDLMDDAWWGPVSVVPGEDRARMLVIEKSMPGSILVNKRGERFVNESLPYNDIVQATYAKNTPDAPCVPAYLVFDATYRRNYPCGPALQATQQPDWALPRKLQHGYFKKADTLEDLAALLDIDAKGLTATVEKLNEYARSGVDLEFHRGETDIERYYGDARVTPNPCLAPLEAPPFYALEVNPGEIGTKGGLQTDASARVLRESGEVIPGLYAFGNCSASVMGRSYPGAGATLSAAATFGYIAARHVTSA
jgi:3-oxosteroid 1-dehydrogenase